MRTLLIGLVLLCGCASTESGESEVQQASVVTFHESMKGASATASFIDQASSIHITVGENANGGTRGAFLIYEYTAADPASYICNGRCYYTRYVTAYGWGDIPTSDV